MTKRPKYSALNSGYRYTDIFIILVNTCNYNLSEEMHQCVIDSFKYLFVSLCVLWVLTGSFFFFQGGVSNEKVGKWCLPSVWAIIIQQIIAGRYYCQQDLQDLNIFILLKNASFLVYVDK